MIDYEGMILARQEMIEISEDCHGDCSHCGMWNVCPECEDPEEPEDYPELY